MASLKSLIPGLARFLEMKPAAIYERQRALVRAGLLKMEPGHGPGSGVRVTPHSVAILIIALAAPSSLSEIGKATENIAKLKNVEKRCPLTGKKTFADALTAVFASKALLKRLGWIDIERLGAQYRADIVLRKEPQEYYTVVEMEHMLAKGQKPNREKMNPVRDSRFGVNRFSDSGSPLRTRTSLFLYWARAFFEDNKT